MITIDTKAYILRFFVDIVLFYGLFFMLNKQGTKRNRILFIVIIFPLTFFVGLYSSFSDLILVICGYLFLKRKHEKDYRLLSSLIVCMLVLYMVDIISSTVMVSVISNDHIVGFFEIFIQIGIKIGLIGLFYFFYQKMHMYQVIQKFSSESSAFLLMYLFLVTLLITYAAHYYAAYDHFVIGIIIFLIIQTVFVFFLFLRILNKQKERYEAQMERQELDNLKMYTKELEEKQQQTIKFRHDYKNLLLSFKEIVSSGQNFKMVEQIEELEHYSDKYLSKDKFDYKAFYNIHDSFIKSILIAKFHRARELNIQCHLECVTPVDGVPIPTFDCVRILGILLDNAMEAAVESTDKIIDLMIYQDDSQIEFLIKNTYKNSDISMDKLQNRGLTTKEGHSGLGLNTIHEYNQKYPNIFVQYQRKNLLFSTQIILIK
ncbi:ATPase [Dellaglioa algida]|nr:ATPase [Dellaglioa algida]